MIEPIDRRKKKNYKANDQPTRNLRRSPFSKPSDCYKNQAVNGKVEKLMGCQIPSVQVKLKRNKQSSGHDAMFVMLREKIFKR